jgi:hypothetical protein
VQGTAISRAMPCRDCITSSMVAWWCTLGGLNLRPHLDDDDDDDVIIEDDAMVGTVDKISHSTSILKGLPFQNMVRKG